MVIARGRALSEEDKAERRGEEEEMGKERRRPRRKKRRKNEVIRSQGKIEEFERESAEDNGKSQRK